MSAITKRRLCITADDYGPVPFFNNGILTAVENDCINAVSVFCNRYPNYDLETEVEKLINKIDNRNIGIGVHLTISSGYPLTNNPELKLEQDQNGNHQFQNIGSFDFGLNEPHIKAIKEEIASQIRALKDILDGYGKQIDHISVHHGLLTIFNPYYKALLEVLNQINLKAPIRNPMPISKMKKFKKHHFGKSKMKKEGVSRALKLARYNLDSPRLASILKRSTNNRNFRKKQKQALERGHICPYYLFDNFYGKARPVDLKNAILEVGRKKQKRQGELMVHLGEGHGGNDLFNGINNGYNDYRIKELEALLNTDFKQLINDRNIELCPLSQFELG